MSQSENNQDTMQIFELIGTKPKCKSLLRKLNSSEFEKLEKILLASLADIRKELEEHDRKEKQKQALINEQLEVLVKEHGIPLSEIKAHLAK